MGRHAARLNIKLSQGSGVSLEEHTLRKDFVILQLYWWLLYDS